MLTESSPRLIAFMLAVTLSGHGLQAGEPANLIINGDAETGDMTGWMPNDQLQIVSSSSADILGLLPCESIGAYSITGQKGAPTEVAMQIIDLSDESAEIDAGNRVFTFTGLIQSRRLSGAIDTGVIELIFRDENGQTTDMYLLEDTHITEGVFDWNSVARTEPIPPMTRTVEVRLVGSRNAGLSTNCYFDNLSLIVTPPQCSLADLTRDGRLDFFDVSEYLAAYIADDPIAEFTGDCEINFFDISAFLSVFNYGCP